MQINYDKVEWAKKRVGIEKSFLTFDVWGGGGSSYTNTTILFNATKNAFLCLLNFFFGPKKAICFSGWLGSQFLLNYFDGSIRGAIFGFATQIWTPED